MIKSEAVEEAENNAFQPACMDVDWHISQSNADISTNVF